MRIVVATRVPSIKANDRYFAKGDGRLLIPSYVNAGVYDVRLSSCSVRFTARSGSSLFSESEKGNAKGGCAERPESLATRGCLRMHGIFRRPGDLHAPIRRLRIEFLDKPVGMSL